MVEQQTLPAVAGASSSAGQWTNWGADAPYHGASTRREAMRSWTPSRGSADRDVLQSREVLTHRSRDLVRNVPVAAAAVLTMTTNVVGTGLRVRPRLNAAMLGMTQDAAEEWQEKAKALFNIWAASKNCDAERKSTYYQLQDLALRTKLVAGNCFALLPLRYNPSWPFALCVKLLDGDRCANPQSTLDTDQLAGGVEVDDFGAPVAYHFTIKPPNGILGNGCAVQTVRVPAFGETSGRPLVLHLFEQDRPDQRLGVSWLAPVVEVIKQQGRYQDAEIMAAVVQGMFTVFVKTPAGAADPFGNTSTAENQQIGIAPERGEIGLKYGGVVDLAEGEDIELANPSRPNPNYEPFVNSIFREIGAALGIPYENMMKYFSSSYTAARAAFLEAWKTFKRGRADLNSDFNQPIYENVLAEFISLGLLDAPGFWTDPLRRALWCQADWVGEAPGQLNPVVETQAAKMLMDEQLKDRTSTALELTGEEYSQVVAGQAREKVLREKAGLPEPGGVQKTESVSVAAGPTDNPGGGTPSNGRGSDE